MGEQRTAVGVACEANSASAAASRQSAKIHHGDAVEMADNQQIVERKEDRPSRRCRGPSKLRICERIREIQRDTCSLADDQFRFDRKRQGRMAMRGAGRRKFVAGTRRANAARDRPVAAAPGPARCAAQRIRFMQRQWLASGSGIRASGGSEA